MIYIRSVSDGLELFKALGSDVRVEIIRILLENNGMNMNELAKQLNITNGALTGHIRKLEECGIVTISTLSSGHGNQKICRVQPEKILINMQPQEKSNNIYYSKIKIGQYSDFNIQPACGMATEKHLIGEFDDPRYFSHEDRQEAGILWFNRGYVEYPVPNFIPHGQKIDEIDFTMELSAEVSVVGDSHPGDIYFYLNNTCLGYWTSPGEFTDNHGNLTPDWWLPDWNQHGLLKMLQVNHKGTFIDGIRISSRKIDDFHLTSRSNIRLRIGVPRDAAHPGGITLYGDTFGNYNQDIDVQIIYSPLEESETTRRNLNIVVPFEESREQASAAGSGGRSS